MPRRLLTLRLALTTAGLAVGLGSCGGGGGGGSSGLTTPAITLPDAAFAAGADTLEIPLLLGEQGTPPTLVQFDVVSGDPLRIDFTARLVNAAALPTAEAHLVAPGRLRIALGDATSRDGAAPLPRGAVARIELRRVDPAATGTVELRIESTVGSDAGGSTADVDATGARARVTL
ncbi:MAG: hypothetical protein IPM29_12390 [Planctomycetes bacterium]|nr:hypothetical protein [Planctomycetota bacterium]